MATLASLANGIPEIKNVKNVNHLHQLLIAEGFARGKTDASIYHQESTDVTLVIHVDDLLGAGPTKELKEIFDK